MVDSLPRWRDKRFLVMLALGFAAGVPLPLSAFTLSQWLSESNLSLAAIGFTALIGLSYSLKFLWSPLIDHSPPPFFRALGRRRGWLLSIQIPLIGAIIALGQTNPALDVSLTEALLQALQQCAHNGTRLLVLRGAGKNFCGECMNLAQTVINSN